MPQDYSQIARELRRETCPAQVADEVRRKIRAQEPGRRRARLFYASAAALLSVAMLCGAGLWRAHVQAREQARMAQRAQTVRQAYAALDLIGSALADAGARSEKTIIERTLPPLRECLRESKNKILRNKAL